ncbi:MAG TPA: hypothetical protein VNK91_13685, partial [Burkholderiaceae bacterium]|nr:hypothetical protein [Burkholderiaceae bacterium]
LEAAVAFYDGASFNNSPAGKALAGATGGGIELDATQIEAIAGFLRVLNALENIRAAVDALQRARSARLTEAQCRAALEAALADTRDAIRVLDEAGLHPAASGALQRASRLIQRAQRGWYARAPRLDEAIALHRLARAELIEG